MRRPTSIRSTNTAKANCKPKPQTTVLTRMARRSVEKMNASVNMVSRPRMPVNRPISIFLPTYLLLARELRGEQAGSSRPLEHLRSGNSQAASSLPGQYELRNSNGRCRAAPRLQLDRGLCDGEQFQPPDRPRLLSSPVLRRELRRRCPQLHNSCR